MYVSCLLRLHCFLHETRVDIMNKSSCELLLQYFPSISDAEDMYSTNAANCVFNSFLSYTAIMLNILTIHAMRKTSSLPKTLKTLLLTLAVSDVGVGLLVQPFYTSLLVKWLQTDIPGCKTLISFLFLLNMFSHVSFYLVVAISVDRFLAVHLHLRYQELVTHKRVVAVVIFISLLSAFNSLMALWVPPDIRYLYIFVVQFVCVFVTTVAYIRVYFAVRRHENQIQSQDGAHTGEMSASAAAIKTAVGVFYVYFVFLVCYLPIFIFMGIIRISGPGINMKKFYLFSLTLICLNSSLNPVIYCWKMRHIRHAIMDILRNMSWNRNHPPH